MDRKLADLLAEKLHDFNPMLNVNVTPITNHVRATINKLEMNKEQLITLAEVVGDREIMIDRTGARVRMVIR